MDLETLDLIKKLLNRRLDNVKTNLIYNVDDEKQLMYHRGQIKSLEDLQQDIKDLLKNRSSNDNKVHGATETDRRSRESL